MRHLYLSPHLDDAILSCGGLIHRQRMKGEPVTVATLCAGIPDYRSLSILARRYHTAWSGISDPVAARRAEDVAVLGAWGVVAHHGNTLDSIYRCVNGDIAYPDDKALFGDPQPRERAILPARWCQEIRPLCGDRADTTIYAPLAAGNHVDHRMACALGATLAEQGWCVWFYEDYPHAESPDALRCARRWFGDVRWQTLTIAIDVDAKVTAIAGYQTQLAFMFTDLPTMADRVRRYTAETACDISVAERLRRALVGTGGRRERLWRRVCRHRTHAERLWRPT